MRVRSVLSTLAVGLMLVVGVDYVSYAATGKSMVLGKANKASQVTALKRTTPGPALKLSVKPGSAPFAVSSGKKVAKLNADRLDGLDSAALGGHVTGFTSQACGSVTPVPTTYTKVTDVGTLTTRPSARWTRIEYSSTYSAELGGSTAVAFQLRVDDQPSTVGQGTYLVRDEALYFDDLTGVFKGLTPGAHTISLWAKGINASATRARINSGCFDDANNVLVTESR